jgi:uncharacterized protein YaiE (UPF0345 family)
MKKLILFFTVCLGLTAKTYACDCPPLETLSADHLSQYHLIFKGHADSVGFLKDKGIAWFTIEELYKGVSTKVSEIYFEISGSCPVRIEKGDEWIVYATYASYGKPVLSFCSRSRKFFPDVEKDFYVANNRMLYSDEAAFLKKNFGIHPFVNPPSSTDLQTRRELIHPNPAQMLYWLGASLLGFFGIYLFSKKILK